MHNTLLVDGNSLLQTGFHGVKYLYHNEQHIGGTFHFLNTLRTQLTNYDYTKIVVFWDGKNNAQNRKDIYPPYKGQRKSFNNEEHKESFYRQKQRVQEYLEELYVRQGEYENCEADDCIAFYSRNKSHGEKVTILTADKDLIQLIDDDVFVYLTSLQRPIGKGESVKLNKVMVPHYNFHTIKSICGDSSDNIYGIKLVGVKSLTNLVPELTLEKVTLEEVLETVKNHKKKNTRVKNINEGITKNGIEGIEVIYKNHRILSLGKEFLSGPVINDIESLVGETLDPEGRHWKNALKLMMSDGILNILPKNDEGLVTFLKPFLRLTRLEKQKFKKLENE